MRTAPYRFVSGGSFAAPRASGAATKRPISKHATVESVSALTAVASGPVATTIKCHFPRNYPRWCQLYDKVFSDHTVPQNCPVPKRRLTLSSHRWNVASALRILLILSDFNTKFIAAIPNLERVNTCIASDSAEKGGMKYDLFVQECCAYFHF